MVIQEQQLIMVIQEQQMKMVVQEQQMKMIIQEQQLIMEILHLQKKIKMKIQKIMKITIMKVHQKMM